MAGTADLSAQAPATPVAEDIRGPRGPVEIPVPEKPPIALWSGIGAGLLAVAVAWFLIKRFERDKQRKSPLVVALGALNELAGTRESLAAEAFANRAAQTVRQYISEQFGLAAPRRTTEEFLRDLAKNDSSPLIAESDHLRVFLKSCDLAKFAGSNLNMNQRDDLLHAARGFIETTSAPVLKPNSEGGAP
ncbi:MAG: hypothetical protein ABI600_04830 [Luteolibacter sp.]